jgi:hypothetical protein
MIHKFRLHENDDMTGQSGFADWIAQKKPARRAGKPLLVAKTWKVSSDPWRRVTKCAVGLDIMKRYKCSDTANSEMSRETKITGLMAYDTTDNPTLHSNVYAQRISMYGSSHQVHRTPHAVNADRMDVMYIQYNTRSQTWQHRAQTWCHRIWDSTITDRWMRYTITGIR